MCGAITLFIFLAPPVWFHPQPQWFRDQPRIPHASQITSLPGYGEAVFWIEPELVSTIPEPQRLDKLGRELTARTGKKQVLTRIEPIYDSEREIKGYMAYSRP